MNGAKFKDINGEELEGKLIFPRLSKQGVDSFINENVIPHSEIFAMIIPNKGENFDIRTDKTEDNVINEFVASVNERVVRGEI